MTAAPVTWDAGTVGVLSLPGGRRVRGRGLRTASDGPAPDYGLYLLARDPRPFAWTADWTRWPDFRLPTDPRAFTRQLRTAYERAAYERVEIACRGGRGRTGTALACLAVLDGMRPDDAVAYVREHYRSGAVETRGQRRFVTRFANLGAG